MYACVVCGADLFSSATKYESGCGWPSFYDVDPTRLLFKEDLRHGRKRTEVTCSNCDAHLGEKSVTRSASDNFLVQDMFSMMDQQTKADNAIV